MAVADDLEDSGAKGSSPPHIHEDWLVLMAPRDMRRPTNEGNVSHMAMDNTGLGGPSKTRGTIGYVEGGAEK